LRTIQKEVRYSAFLCLKHPDRHASGGGRKRWEKVGRGESVKENRKNEK